MAASIASAFAGADASAAAQSAVLSNGVLSVTVTASAEGTVRLVLDVMIDTADVEALPLQWRKGRTHVAIDQVKQLSIGSGSFERRAGHPRAWR